VKQLASLQRLLDRGDEGSGRHLLMTDLGIHPEQLGAFQRLNEAPSAWPTVGSRMSPRGSFGLGSIAKRRS